MPELNPGGAALSQAGIQHGRQQEALSGDSLFDSLFYSWCSPPPPQTSEREPANQIHSFAYRKSLVGGSLELLFPSGGDVTGCHLFSTPLFHPRLKRERYCRSSLKRIFSPLFAVFLTKTRNYFLRHRHPRVTS